LPRSEFAEDGYWSIILGRVIAPKGVLKEKAAIEIATRRWVGAKMAAVMPLRRGFGIPGGRMGL
jgi:hypothetical protein